MKFSTLAAGAIWAGSALAAPTGLEARQATNIDPVVLQFALTLEHLENVFYKQALQKFSKQDFLDAGYSDTYYNNLRYIAFDEQSHVQLLTSAIAAAGYTPVAPCTYKFPYTDVASFITLSSIIEGVGTSAYLGGAPLITSKSYLTVAGSILVTEALHTSYQRAAKGEIPMANPYGTPLDPTAVFTLASAFIVSCPSTNFALPFTPFPGLTYDATTYCTCEGPDCSPSAAVKRGSSWSDWNGPSKPSSTAVADTRSNPNQSGPSGTASPASPSCSAAASWGGKPKPVNGCSPPSAGATIKFTAAKPIPAGSYVTFVNGLSVVSVKGTISGADVTVAIPSVVSGQAYVLISNSDQEGTVNDANVLFGPAIIEVQPAPPAIDFTQAK